VKEWINALDILYLIKPSLITGELYWEQYLCKQCFTMGLCL